MVHRFALVTGVSLRSGLRKGLQWLTLAAMLATACFAQQPDDLLAPYRLATWQKDGRTAKRITLEVLGRPLREAVWELSLISGVSLRISKECAQWRVVLCVKDATLADVLAGMAYTFDLSWRAYSTGEGKPPGYELYQSPTQKERSDDLLWGRALRRCEVVQLAIPRALALLQQGIRPNAPRFSYPTTQEQAVNRCVYDLLQNPAGLHALSVLRGEELLQVFSGEVVFIPAERFSDEQRQMIAPETATVTVYDITGQSKTVEVSQQLRGVLWEYKARLGSLFAAVLTRQERYGISRQLMEIPVLDYGESTRDVLEDMDSDRLVKLLSPPERQRTPSTDEPGLEVMEVPQRLRRLSAMLSLSVIAEYYPLTMHVGWASAGRTAGEALEVLGPYFWVRRAGNLLLFRARVAAEHRLRDVPQQLMDRWFGNRNRFGFTLDLLREMDGVLNRYQSEALAWWCSGNRAVYARRSPAWSAYMDRMSEALEGRPRLCLRLFWSLPSEQQKLLLAGQRVTLPLSPAVEGTLSSLGQQLLRDGSDVDMPLGVRYWLQVKCNAKRVWAYEGASLFSEYYVRLEDMWHSLPGESLEAFQQRLRQTHSNLNENLWLEAEEEVYNFQIGTGEKTVLDQPLFLIRFRRLPASAR
jgi:hypothetical protein